MYSSTGIETSDFVSAYNSTFYFIGGISLFLLIALTATMLWFVFRFNKKRHKEAKQIEGNTWLEIAWTVIPILLALSMFYFGWAGWKPIYNPPEDTFNITSIARQWSFSFSYENGKQSTDLVVPLNTPVKLNLISGDVNHSLYIPEYRLKTDIIPGQTKFMWFNPSAEGKYQIYCAEYCGLRHSYMYSNLIVMTKEDFEKWYAEGETVAVATPGMSEEASKGLSVMNIQGCFACHSTDGTKIVGPTYFKLYGSQVTVLVNGEETTMIADETYLRQCIEDPTVNVVKGYPSNLMQKYKGKLSDEEIDNIIEYIKTLQ